MPKIDLTVTISVIIALCAIVSPILTAIINNRHQLKLRKLELRQKQYENTIMYQRNIFENYLRYSGKCLSRANSDSLREYGEYYLIALMYAPSEIKEKMISANNFLQNYDLDAAGKIYEELAPMIHALLQKL